MKTALRMAERGLLPDSAIRLGIHKLLRHRLLQIDPGDCQSQEHFCHRDHPYIFAAQNDDDWMGQHFFTGGLMPSDDLFLYFQRDLIVDAHWRVDSTHYARTARQWLENMDEKRGEILPMMAQQYGEKQSRLWFRRWRIFFMACEELFGFAGGQEWWVAHYRFCKRPQNGKSND